MPGCSLETCPGQLIHSPRLEEELGHPGWPASVPTSLTPQRMVALLAQLVTWILEPLVSVLTVGPVTTRVSSCRCLVSIQISLLQIAIPTMGHS